MVTLRQLDTTYLKMAEEWSQLSRAERRKVGALIVKDGQIISDGFNGTPSGFNNKCENSKGDTLDEVLHAESNAIAKLARSSQSSEGATLYLTLSPCMDCAKLILQAGIKRVVFSEVYRIRKGLQLLDKAGIKTVYYPEKKLPTSWDDFDDYVTNLLTINKFLYNLEIMIDWESAARTMEALRKIPPINKQNWTCLAFVQEHGFNL